MFPSWITALVVTQILITVAHSSSSVASSVSGSVSEPEDQGGGADQDVSAGKRDQFRCACEPHCEGDKDFCTTTAKCYMTKLSGLEGDVLRGCLWNSEEVKSKCGIDFHGLQDGVYQCCEGDFCNKGSHKDDAVYKSDDPHTVPYKHSHISEPYGLQQRYYRCACDPLCNNQPHCFTEGQCFAAKDHRFGMIVRNCFSNEEQSNLNCNSKAKTGNFVCCLGDLCNANLTVEAIMPTDGSSSQASTDARSSHHMVLLVAGVAACVTALLAIVALVLVIRKRRQRHLKELGLKQQAANCKLLEADALWREDFGDGMSSGSGRGQPHLVKQTVGKQVTMEKLIGKGRFGEVWRGKWRGEDVAVKTFSSREETSYKQECEIYNTILLRHDNILGFCAADTIGINSTTQHLLIMHYHRNGSLYDYLQNSDLDIEDMLILAHSASAGLAHLHEEILEGGGRRVKPAIAHRDVKSKNILVKDNGQCCIGDLGHAVRNDSMLEPEEEESKKTKVQSGAKLWCFKDQSGSDSNESLPSDSESKQASEPIKLLVGTKRYMAPEVLNGELNPTFFESFKRVDVYAFGLVLWEIAKRVRPYADVYHPPFWDVAPHDPTLEDMRKVVVDHGIRPPIPNQWENDQMMSFMAQMMHECWSQTPSSRLTILRVKKNLHCKLRQLRGKSPSGGEKKLTRCASLGSTSSSGICKQTLESGGRIGGYGGMYGVGRARVGYNYGYLMRGGTSSGCESSSGVSGVSGGISETYTSGTERV